MKVQRDGRNLTIDVAADGEGLVSHAGAALMGEVADRIGLTGELTGRLAGVRSAADATIPAGWFGISR